MNYDRILIRYGELSTKGKNRKGFIDKLKRNIKNKLRDFPNIIIEKDRERMFILLNGEDGDSIVERLRGIFGIQSFSPAIKTDREIESIKEAALTLFRKIYQEGNTFKITTKRSDKNYFLNTDEMNHTLGAHLLINVPGLKVNVKNPDINMQIEIRRDAVYISCENILGAGGLPVGSSGKAMLMLSGGIDSPVAGFLSMKRGLEIEAIHFYSPPFTSERSKQKVVDLAEKLAGISGKVKLHVVPFTEIQQVVVKKIPENYLMTTTRRLMLKIADEIRIRNEGLAIVTGESLGQVASQTLESMFAINAVINTPIIRPLITMDKSEIIDIARKIDTFEISNRPYEDCCTVFVPAAPKTKPKKEKVEHFESYVDFESLIKESVENVETIIITPSSRKQESTEDLF